MKKIKVKDSTYYTNILDLSKTIKCVKFFSDGCTSYAISFNNKQSDIIKQVNLEGHKVNYLRNMNFNECFIPERAKGLTDSESVLKKGLDLIELL